MIKEWDLQNFAKFESEEDLYSRTYCGVPYWQILKFNVSQYLNSNYEEIGKEINAGICFSDKILKVLSNLFYGLKSELKLLFLKKKTFDFIYFKTGAIHNKFYDFWDSENGFEVFHLSDTHMKGEYNLCFPKVLFSLWYHISKLAGCKWKDVKEHQFFPILEKKMRNRFGRSPSAADMEAIVQNSIMERILYRKYFKRLFRQIHAKAMVVVCYYQGPLYAAYDIARESGVKIIELQHGTIIDHTMYCFENQIGINNITPDYMLTFGELWASWAKLSKTTVPVPVGYPYQEEQLRRIKRVTTKENLVVIYPTPVPEFEMMISEFAQKAVHDGYKVYIKIHPNESKDVNKYYPILIKDQNVHIVTDQSKGVYYWLKAGRHQVFAATTVALESVTVENRNACIAIGFPHKQGQPLIDLEMARGFYTADELLEYVKNPMIKDIGDDVKEKIWKANAAVNIRCFFDDFKRGTIKNKHIT